MSTCSRTRAPQLLVRRLCDRATLGFLECGPLRVRCALGRGGLKARKREGDGATPLGRLKLIAVYYNPSRTRRPQTALPLFTIRPSDGWCDSPDDRNYNKRISHPYRASAERLWRDDGLYDVVVVLDHNLTPCIKGFGSAIFMHVARPGYRPTEGCIALDRHHLTRLLKRVRAGTCLITKR